MKTLIPILFAIFLIFGACKKDEPESTPQPITYPEYHDGKLNLLGVTSDTIFVSSTGLEFIIAADVPAEKSIRFVCQPEYGNFWNGFGFYLSQPNSHLDWVTYPNSWDFISLEEETAEDKLCKVSGLFAPFGSSDPNEPNVSIHVLVYEDKSTVLTRKIVLTPI